MSAGAGIIVMITGHSLALSGKKPRPHAAAKAGGTRRRAATLAGDTPSRGFIIDKTVARRVTTGHGTACTGHHVPGRRLVRWRAQQVGTELSAGLEGSKLMGSHSAIAVTRGRPRLAARANTRRDGEPPPLGISITIMVAEPMSFAADAWFKLLPEAVRGGVTRHVSLGHRLRRQGRGAPHRTEYCGHRLGTDPSASHLLHRAIVILCPGPARRAVLAGGVDNCASSCAHSFP